MLPEQYIDILREGFVFGLPEQRGGNSRGSIWITNGKDFSVIAGGTSIPDGWWRGYETSLDHSHFVKMSEKRHTTEKDLLHSNKLSGMKQIHRGGVFKRIPPDQLDFYLGKGWDVRKRPLINKYQISIDGVVYETISAASLALGLDYQVIFRRVNGNDARYENWIKLIK